MITHIVCQIFTKINYFDTGLTRYLWSSLGLIEYSEGCQYMCNGLKAMVRQMDRGNIEINNKVKKKAEFSI